MEIDTFRNLHIFLKIILQYIYDTQYNMWYNNTLTFNYFSLFFLFLVGNERWESWKVYVCVHVHMFTSHMYKQYMYICIVRIWN